MRVATFFGLFLLPNWLQIICILVWCIGIGLSAYTMQFWAASLMSITLILFLYMRHQYGQGRDFLDRLYSSARDRTRRVAERTRDIAHR